MPENPKRLSFIFGAFRQLKQNPSDSSILAVFHTKIRYASAKKTGTLIEFRE